MHYKTIFTQISDKLPEYVNLQKISINEFTYSTANDKVNHLKISKFEHNFFSHSFKYPLFMNFTKPTTLESIILIPKTASKSTTFLEFPVVLKIFIAIENKPFLLHTISSGLIENCEPIQLILAEAVTCDRLKIELINGNLFSDEIEVIFIRHHKKSEMNLNDQLSTPLPERTIYPGTSDTYINKNFNGYFGVDQIRIGEGNEYQISGCHFIDCFTRNRIYFIRLSLDIPIYDNIFENTENIPDTSSIFWASYNGKLTITRCKFIRITNKADDGCALLCDVNYLIESTIEECEFIDCGRTFGKSTLFTLSHRQSSINFFCCNFKFTEAIGNCNVLELRSNGALFDNCQFVKCGNNSIHITKNEMDEFPFGSFQFTNNNIASISAGIFINARKLRSNFSIRNNIFTNVTINSGNYFIYILHNQSEIELYNNTFYHINTTGNVGSNSGGIATFIENTDSEFRFKITECKFDDFINQNQSGGVFQYKSDLNVHIEFKKCEFKHNKAKHHGGAISIRTSKSIEIINCIFESNFANSNEDDGKYLLFTNYDDNKEKGFGGAIFLTPSFNLKNKNYNMSNVTISHCTFINNHAVKGCAIYIEGDDCGTVFNISNNEFHCNCENIHCNGGIIACELSNLSKQVIINSNDFYNNESCINIEKFIYTDHSGNQLEDSIFPSEIEIPISIKIDNMIITGTIGCNDDTKCSHTEILDYPCGKTCWSRNEHLATFECTFKGEGFQVYGTYSYHHGKCLIYLDNELFDTINQNSPNHKNFALMYTSRYLPYGEHTVKIVGIGEFSISEILTSNFLSKILIAIGNEVKYKPKKTINFTVIYFLKLPQ